MAAGSLAIQRGLEDASQTGGVGAITGLALAAGLVLAVPAWFLLPPADTVPDRGTGHRESRLRPQTKSSGTARSASRRWAWSSSSPPSPSRSEA